MAHGTRVRAWRWGVLGVVMAGAACSAGPGGTQARAPAKVDARAPSHRSVVGYSAPLPNGRQERVRQGSGVVLATIGSTLVAYVADEDDGTIHVVDVQTLRELTTFDAGGTPAQMMMTADDRLLVALRDKAQVKIFEPLEGAAGAAGAMSERAALDTAAEPFGLALSPDDRTLLVTSGWGHALTAFDTKDLRRRFQVDLTREPRSVVVSDDGTKAYVSHAVGSVMSVVDLREGAHSVRSIALKGPEEEVAVARPEPAFTVPMVKRRNKAPSIKKIERTACQGFALAKSVAPEGRILAPQVLVESGDTTVPSTGYGAQSGRAAEVPDVAVIDQGSDGVLPGSLFVRAPRENLRHSRDACLLPRAAAIDPVRGSLFVTCVGSNALSEYDAASSEPHHAELRHWQVPAGPTAVAIDWAAGRAIVWSQFDRILSVVTLGRTLEQELSASSQPIIRVALSRRPAQPETADLAAGRKLFHSSGDPRIAEDGRACASCHPDGRDDAITWSTPEGPRQTPMLAGRLTGTAPYAWSGTGDDLPKHLSHTFGRLRGRGLPAQDLDSLVAYITQMAPPSPAVAVAGPGEAAERARLERGSQIFHSSEAACATCHGKNGAEPDGLKHDVAGPADHGGHAMTSTDLDTPSLRFVGGSAPYFHDGRYRSIRALLVESDGKMGNVSHLSPADLDALEAYVRSL